MNVLSSLDEYDSVAEATGPVSPFKYGHDIFQFSQPVSFVATYAFSVPTYVNSSGGMGIGQDNDPTGPPDTSVFGAFYSSYNSSTSPLTSSGVLLANTSYGFQENWNLVQNQNNPASFSATDDVTITFTAIPEPSSFCLLTVACTSLLARRRSRQRGVSIGQSNANSNK